MKGPTRFNRHPDTCNNKNAARGGRRFGEKRKSGLRSADNIDAHVAGGAGDGAESRLFAVAIHVGALGLDDFKTCLRVTLPTFSLLGTLDPEAIPAAFLSNTEAGGDFRMKVKDLSW